MLRLITTLYSFYPIFLFPIIPFYLSGSFLLASYLFLIFFFYFLCFITPVLRTIRPCVCQADLESGDEILLVLSDLEEGEDGAEGGQVARDLRQVSHLTQSGQQWAFVSTKYLNP